jgi:putative peptidoglycan lipid II flippase
MLSVVLVVGGTDGADPRATLVGLGVASSIGMAVAGVGLLAGAGRARVSGRVPSGLLEGLPRAAAAIAASGAVGTVAGRLVTDLVLQHGGGTLGAGLLTALVAGLLGAVVTLGIVLGGLALTDGGDLRAVLIRRPAPDPGGARTSQAFSATDRGGSLP